jgi:hypothetical protein
VVARRWQTALPKVILVIHIQLLTHGSIIDATFTTFSVCEGVLWTRLTFRIVSGRRIVSFVLLAEGLALLQRRKSILIALRRFQLLFSDVLDLSEVEEWNNLAARLRDFGF